jgi:hypothetical protein
VRPIEDPAVEHDEEPTWGASGGDLRQLAMGSPLPSNESCRNAATPGNNELTPRDGGNKGLGSVMCLE